MVYGGQFVQTPRLPPGVRRMLRLCVGSWGTVEPSTPYCRIREWNVFTHMVCVKQLRVLWLFNFIVFFSSVDSSERPSSNTPIHYRSVHCSGEEDGLIDCPDISTATAPCSHAQDAYIVCRPLSGGISRKLHQEFITIRVCNSNMVSIPAIWIEWHSNLQWICLAVKTEQ